VKTLLVQDLDAPDVARLTGLLERLVAIDTQNPPGREAEAASLLASELEAIGFSTEVHFIADGRANVVGRIDNGDGPCFAFNSHMDTVPAGGGWTSDPFRLTEGEGKLFGRGACDAKGAIAAMAEAARLLASRRELWRGALVIMFVADEEADGGGSRALAKQEPRPDLIVIGEPTNNAVFAAHKGCLRPLIRAKGKAAHSGRPELGVNAILAASQLTSIFDARDRELRALNHPLVGHASLSVTRISGGVADNVIPENCEMVLDRRLLPGESLDDALDDLHALLDRAKRDHGVEAEIAAIRTKAGSTETPVDDPLVREAVAISRAHGVTFPQPGGLTGGCDLVHFQDVGSVGIVLGPGSLDVAHQPDEYVPKDDLARAALIYRDLAVAMMQP
jgi:acetylornithine deacetylase/succinyl-diaminopimelate desuccinylase